MKALLLISFLPFVIGNALHLRAQVLPHRITAEQTDRLSQLVGQLKDGDNDARKVAAEALAQIGVPAVERLIGALRDKDASIRCLAVEALGKIKDPRSIEPLTAALNDPNDEVQHSAAEALGTQLPANLMKTSPKDGLIYVWIPPGRFAMGCSGLDRECAENEKPAHRVTITKGFWMGQTTVTQAAYLRVMGNNPSYFKENRSLFRSQNLPVEQLSWNDAQTYCERIGMRLPTEAEWEYAARGGTKASRYGELGSFDSVAWYNDNSGEALIDQGSDPHAHTEEKMWRQTHPVGQQKPNLYGLYDMLGNVKQWVGDWFGPYPLSAVTDPPGPTSGQFKVVRGASYADHSDHVRVSARESAFQPADRSNEIGFRCVGN